ncbi:uncharacterized protein isoform X2 [Leptinotarsa decemlineata]|uniref:uncharacterized protein isoform X2 n=1 Tax=Leptinotarsa decemlineata TaxID=7539 RepID=UPI003D30BEE3
MSCRKCCISKCSASAMLHKFPNPGKHLEQFRKWVQSINDRDINEMNPVMVYRSKRICHKHFEAKYYSSMSSRLQPMAVPTLYLQGSTGPNDVYDTPSTSKSSNSSAQESTRFNELVIEFPELNESSHSIEETEPDTFCKEEDEVVGELVFFNHDESLKLIGAYRKHEHLFKIISSNASVWNLISAELDCEDIQKNPKECETEWKNLVKAYRTYIKDKVGGSKFMFVNEMEAIFKTEKESIIDEIEDIKIEYDETAGENEIVGNDCEFWSFSETSALVEAYGHLRKSFAKEGHGLQTWSQISSELSSKNIHRSPESCESKWESLVQKHNGDQTNYEFHNDVCNAQDEESTEQSSKKYKGDCECYERKIVEKQKRHRERMDMMKRKLDIEERKLAAFEKYLVHLSNGKE